MHSRKNQALPTNPVSLIGKQQPHAEPADRADCESVASTIAYLVKEDGTVNEADKAYFARRATEERTRASEATNDTVRSAHEIMADQYERAARGEPIQLRIVERG